MIYVSAGHEKGIGLEVFFRSFILLNSREQKQYTLFIDENNLKESLKNLNYDYTLEENTLLFLNTKLNINLIKVKETLSTDSLKSILKIITDNDILVTLPTSKDQLILNGKSMAGYTEFLRSYYNKDSLLMNFKSHQDFYFLITDHIPLNKVSKAITEKVLEDKISTLIKDYKKYYGDYDEILLSGINPHSGENGILGDEDKAIKNYIKSSNLITKGPLPGDTIHFHKKANKVQLIGYMFHDQGLGIFKSHNYVIGANITFGLPFLRLSVDHGTAFENYGKNISHTHGSSFVLNEANKVHRRLRDE